MRLTVCWAAESGAAGRSFVRGFQFRAFKGGRSASRRMGNRLKQSGGIKGSDVLDDADPRWMFKSPRNCALHGVLKGEIGVMR